MAAASRHTKIKSGVWAVGVFAVITVGTLTGAQLKHDKQKEETFRKFRETTPAEQIAMLEERKAELLDHRATLQRKLDMFQDTVRKREEEKEQKRRLREQQQQQQQQQQGRAGR